MGRLFVSPLARPGLLGRRLLPPDPAREADHHPHQPTSDTVTTFSTEDLADGFVYKNCGNRLASACTSRSATYRRKAACEKILAAMWDIDRAAGIVLALVPPILAAAQLEGRHARLSDAVRTSRFRVNALNGVMKLYDGRQAAGGMSDRTRCHNATSNVKEQAWKTPQRRRQHS